jgi:hypothetical protein
MLQKHLALLAFSLVASTGAAQTKFLPSQAEIQKASEGIVAAVAAGNFSGAMREIQPLSVVPPAELAAVEAQVNSQLDQILRRFGAATGYEQVSDAKLGSRTYRIQYLVFYEKAPMRWSFVYYKAEKGWVLTDFRFDASAQEFFR